LFCETKVIANNVIKNVGKVGFTFWYIANTEQKWNNIARDYSQLWKLPGVEVLRTECIEPHTPLCVMDVIFNYKSLFVPSSLQLLTLNFVLTSALDANDVYLMDEFSYR
jgi:hypothetical protein